MPRCRRIPVVSSMAWGKALNAGQVCIAPDYLLVEAKAKDEWWKPSRPSGRGGSADVSDSPDYGRVVNADQFDRLVDTLEDALSKGATVLLGGRHDRSPRFMEPTLLGGVTPDMRVMREEVFGPLLPVLTWDQPRRSVGHGRAGQGPSTVPVHLQPEPPPDAPMARRHPVRERWASGRRWFKLRIPTCLSAAFKPAVPVVPMVAQPLMNSPTAGASCGRPCL